MRTIWQRMYKLRQKKVPWRWSSSTKIQGYQNVNSRIIDLLHTTVKSHSLIFQGYGETKHMTRENVSPTCTFFKFRKVNKSIHWPRRVIFSCFKSCSHTPHLFARGSTFVPMQLHCRLNHENTSAPKFTCFASQASFVLISKMAAFASTVFLLPITVWTVDRESPRFFAISARFRFESWFTAMKS